LRFAWSLLSEPFGLATQARKARDSSAFRQLNWGPFATFQDLGFLTAVTRTEHADYDDIGESDGMTLRFSERARASPGGLLAARLR